VQQQNKYGEIPADLLTPGVEHVEAGEAFTADKVEGGKVGGIAAVQPFT
jgi:hypothetical protein